MAGVLSPFSQRLRLLISRLAILAVLCLSMGLTACSTANTGITGNYVEDTISVADSLLATIALGADDPGRGAAETQARSLINGYMARYRPRASVNGLASFTTMQTAFNSLAGHYTNYPNRPLPDALKERLTKELNKAETTVARGA